MRSGAAGRSGSGSRARTAAVRSRTPLPLAVRIWPLGQFRGGRELDPAIHVISDDASVLIVSTRAEWSRRCRRFQQGVVRRPIERKCENDRRPQNVPEKLLRPDHRRPGRRGALAACSAPRRRRPPLTTVYQVTEAAADSDAACSTSRSTSVPRGRVFLRGHRVRPGRQRDRRPREVGGVTGGHQGAVSRPGAEGRTRSRSPTTSGARRLPARRARRREGGPSGDLDDAFTAGHWPPGHQGGHGSRVRQRGRPPAGRVRVRGRRGRRVRGPPRSSRTRRSWTRRRHSRGGGLSRRAHPGPVAGIGAEVETRDSPTPRQSSTVPTIRRGPAARQGAEHRPADETPSPSAAARQGPRHRVPEPGQRHLRRFLPGGCQRRHRRQRRQLPDRSLFGQRRVSPSRHRVFGWWIPACGRRRSCRRSGRRPCCRAWRVGCGQVVRTLKRYRAIRPTRRRAAPRDRGAAFLDSEATWDGLEAGAEVEVPSTWPTWTCRVPVGRRGPVPDGSSAACAAATPSSCTADPARDGLERRAAPGQLRPTVRLDRAWCWPAPTWPTCTSWTAGPTWSTCGWPRPRQLPDREAPR